LALGTGRPLREFDLLLKARIAGEAWTWPWFEEWHNFFETEDLWPYMWPAFEPDEDELDDYSVVERAEFRRRAVAPLISHAAAMTAYRDVALSKAPPSAKWRLSSTGDSTEERIANQYRPAIERGDLRVLPPFFPGDRTGLIRAEWR
jgi:hypothetical protein